jgi:hypothetical protein
MSTEDSNVAGENTPDQSAEENDRFDTVVEMIAKYRADRDGGHDDAWWEQADYTVDTAHGVVHLQPSRLDVAEDGATRNTWCVRIDLSGGTVERRFTDGRLPTPAEAERQVAALIRSTVPSRHPERDRVMTQLRELAAQRHKIDAEARRIALEAVADGVKKIAVADAARISRVTLDRWIHGH